MCHSKKFWIRSGVIVDKFGLKKSVGILFFEFRTFNKHRVNDEVPADCFFIILLSVLNRVMHRQPTVYSWLSMSHVLSVRQCLINQAVNCLKWKTNLCCT